MPSDTKKAWDALSIACVQDNLPRPVLEPGLFRDGDFLIRIGPFRVTKGSILDVIGIARIYVEGYSDAQKTAGKEPTEDHYGHASHIARSVLNHPTPLDTERLAKAMLSLCAAHTIWPCHGGNDTY